MIRVSVQSEDFDLGQEVADLQASGAGALVTFSGLVRDLDGGLLHMEIEHYPAMTLKALEEMATTASARWDLSAVTIVHRFGMLRPGDQIMMVATAARHRAGAFAAAEYLMDYLKSRAPFWKKEVTAKRSDWVAARKWDEDALDRWAD